MWKWQPPENEYSSLLMYRPKQGSFLLKLDSFFAHHGSCCAKMIFMLQDAQDMAEMRIDACIKHQDGFGEQLGPWLHT
jgi:hypothetical protein